jgi:HTH-type transcriptional regulator/antitoxin HigA
MVNVNPIRDEKDYDAAMRDLDSLLSAAPGETDEDKIDVLTALVHSYEQQHHRPQIGKPEPVDVILFVMDQRGLSRSDLEPMIGERGRVSDILNRKRPLTITMIRRLSAGLNIPADLLIAEYPTASGKAA